MPKISEQVGRPQSSVCRKTIGRRTSEQKWSRGGVAIVECDRVTEGGASPAAPPPCARDVRCCDSAREGGRRPPSVATRRRLGRRPMTSWAHEGALVTCFGEQIAANERLRGEHERLKHEYEALLRRRQEDELAIADARSAEAQSAEIITSLQATIERYVAVGVLERALFDNCDATGAEGGGGEAAAAANANMQRLEHRLELKEAELAAAQNQLAGLSRARADAAELHVSLETERANARRAEQHARDHEAIAREYEQKLKGLRDALGKAEIDRQRKEAEFQRSLQDTSKKLRSQKALSDQLQRALQQERHEHHQPPPGSAAPIFRAQAPSMSVFSGAPGGRRAPGFAFGRI